MNDRIQNQPSSTAIAVTDPTKTRRVLLVAWFMFLVLAVATVLATRASAQAAAAQRKPAVAAKYDVITLNPQFLDPAIKQKMERAAKAVVTARDLNSFAELPYAKGYIDTYLPAKIT